MIVCYYNHAVIVWCFICSFVMLHLGILAIAFQLSLSRDSNRLRSQFSRGYSLLCGSFSSLGHLPRDKNLYLVKSSQSQDCCNLGDTVDDITTLLHFTLCLAICVLCQLKPCTVLDIGSPVFLGSASFPFSLHSALHYGVDKGVQPSCGMSKPLQLPLSHNLQQQFVDPNFLTDLLGDRLIGPVLSV